MNKMYKTPWKHHQSWCAGNQLYQGTILISTKTWQICLHIHQECIKRAENLISGPQLHLLSMFSNSSKSKFLGSFLVPTHWQWHLPVLWWTPSVHRWRHVCTVPSFPSEQTSPPCHLPILLKQILLTPAIHTNPCPRPSAMANPMAPVPASFLPCPPHPLKTPSFNPYPTPCPVPHCLGSPPLSWGEGADPARVSVLAAAAGVEQAGLPPPREPSYNLPHHLPQALFRCSGQIPEEERLSCGQIRILAAGLGASSCLSGSNVSMDCSSLANTMKEHCREVISQVRLHSFLPA